jgi:hypothetical protein
MPVTLREESTFSDSNRWSEMAKTEGLRLPQWRMPTTTGGMRRWLRKINVSVDKYLADNNDRRLDAFIKRNPDWPLRAWAGIQLENLLWERDHSNAAA